MTESPGSHRFAPEILCFAHKGLLLKDAVHEIPGNTFLFVVHCSQPIKLRVSYNQGNPYVDEWLQMRDRADEWLQLARNHTIPHS